MEKHQVAIVIPAFNEENTIFSVVQSVKRYGTAIVVNDASTDRTQEMAEKAGAITIMHENNKGYDGALNSGFAKAEELSCYMVVTFDADGQHNANLLEEYIQLIDSGFRVVIGNRDKFQRVAEYIFSWVARAKWGIVDPLCGMKAYHIDVYKNLGYFDSYNSIGTELSIFASKSSISIAQLPIMINKRVDKPRFGNRISSNIRILKAIFHGLKL
ncbi:MAG: glycosyltransferase family 2 protein [Gammaproteobacteria bacterium]|nr:glycosyltransferase family 2 protein [Gammaproteobacteria bacterium]